jgi:hypothetical protein
MDWFIPLSARVTVVALETAPPAGEMVGAVLGKVLQVDPVVLPLIVGGALVAGLVSWFMSVFAAAI